MSQKLSTQERNEFAELAEKDWKKTITSAEKLRYLQLLERDTQSKFGIAPLTGEAREQWLKASTKLTSDDITMQLRAADKSTPIPQIEKLKAEALQRDPRTIIPSKAQSEVVP